MQFKRSFARSLGRAVLPVVALSIVIRPAFSSENTPLVRADKVARNPLADFAGQGGFRPLADWNVQLESMRVVREEQVEVMATYKNVLRKQQLLNAGTVSMVLTDGDGLGVRNIGNLFKAGGDPALEPEKIIGNIPLAPGETATILALFQIPQGSTPLKLLTIFGDRAKPVTYDASSLSLPAPVDAVSLPIRDTVGGGGEFVDFNEYSIRFDGVRRGRNNTLQIFLTTKSTDKTTLRSHPGYTLNVAIVDANGNANKGDGFLYRASGDDPEPQKVTHIVTLIPGIEGTLAYAVKLPKDAVPKQLVVKYKDRVLTADLPEMP